MACAPGGRLVDLVRSHGMNVSPLKNMVQPLNPVRDILVTLELFSLIRKNRYSIVHTHNSKAGFVGRLAARMAGVPVIIHTVHGYAFHDQEPPWRRSLFRNLERTASSWADMIIFISQPLIDWALEENICSRNKIVKIYSGIDIDRFSPSPLNYAEEMRKNWNIDKKEQVIGIVSKLWDGKGHKVLIDAFNILKRSRDNVKLMIVGEGYLEDDLKQYVRTLGLKNDIIFTGFQSEVSETIACMDIAVLPSFFEGMGRVILEAMAMEKPVIGSNVGGIPDLVKDNINGFLTEPGDVKGLAQALEKLLGNRELSEKMGKMGRAMISDSYSSNKMVNDIKNLYMECSKRKGLHLD